jgi:hypothetical protein
MRETTAMDHGLSAEEIAALESISDGSSTRPTRRMGMATTGLLMLAGLIIQRRGRRRYRYDITLEGKAAVALARAHAQALRPPPEDDELPEVRFPLRVSKTLD